MNRRQRIIISITGITLVLLILIGLTYGYFLTRIQGNTNEKSISVTTANLLLVYKDGDGNIIEQGNITPGAELGSKTFSVENQGDIETEYVVVVDNVNITKKGTSEKTTFESNDFVYKLTCESDKPESSCNGQGEDTVLPLINGGILVGNKITKGEKQTYTLTVTYKETEFDQTNDMNKSLEAKVDIKSFKDLNPFEEGTLAYKIIKNASTTKTGTELKMTPKTTPLKQVSNEDEKELTIEPDDYGASYYYRGNVEDNYVQFANMCWRVVRIQGDGSVKLILASELPCSENNLTEDSGYATNGDAGKRGSTLYAHYGYKIVNRYYSINDYIESEIRNAESARTQLMTWLGKKIKDQSKLKEEKWCIGDLMTAYDRSGDVLGETVNDLINRGESFEYTAGNRFGVLKTPKLKCETTGTNGEIDTNIIGLLTMDEVTFAGGGKSSNSDYYLNKNATTEYWWTLSPSSFDNDYGYAFFVSGNGNLSSDVVDDGSGAFLLPAVSLVSGVSVSGGNGTISSPFLIE